LNLLQTIFQLFLYHDHQYLNAKFLEKNRASFVIRQNEINKEKILKYLECDIEKLSKNLAKINSKNGAKYIVDEILKEF